MVSFFGIKLGGDKKKAQKNQGKQPPQQWNRIDQNTLGQGQYFGQSQAPGRPQFPNASSRPGTSQNAAPPPSNWRAVFNNPGMASSMTDLTPPSMGALRHNASESNLRTNFANGSTTSLALPASLGGTGARPGTPSRPTTTKAEWVNPLHVHFCKSNSASRPGTPTVATPKSPLGQFEFDLKPAPAPTKAPTRTPADAPAEAQAEAPVEPAPRSKQNERQPVAERHGYPSPPGSDRSSDGAALSKVDRAAASLPSPTPSSPLTGSEDKPDTPVIRNVPARRDTLAFHQPRRLSVKMEFDDERQKEARKTQHIEGFRGNFADFNFGATAKSPSFDMPAVNSVDTSSGERPSVSTESAQARERVQSPSIAGSFSQRSVRSPESPMSRPSVSTSVSAMSLYNERPESPVIKLPAGAPRENSRRTGPPPAAVGARRGNANPFGRTSPLEGSTRASIRPSRLARRRPDPCFRRPTWHRMRAPRRVRAVPASPAAISATVKLPFSRPPMAGDFPKSKGLPRGRQPEKPRCSTEDNNDDDDGSVYDDPAWPEFDRAEPRYSAMPAPLATPRSDPNRSPALPPRLPSPTFPSLAKSISTSSEDLAKSFELHFDAPLSSGLIPSLEQRPGPSSGEVSPKRVEAKKAPPRLAVMTLPPSSSSKDVSAMKSPVEPRFQGGFI
ncbi:hypothetical protein ACCO45_002289 [Purpureocillium lilacinum]|uniref:Uncharacterized protein n=1 Tax=Purpureocillium lilacinum TaxID=33203 RepID=A0ACC4EBV0_PURLI